MKDYTWESLPMFYNNCQMLTLNTSDGQAVRVRLEVNSRARRLIIRLDERRREAVAVAPSSRQIAAAVAFAAERADWISSRLRHLPDPDQFGEGQVISFRGQPCRITCAGTGRLARLLPGDSDGIMALSLPGDEATLSFRVERFLRKEAKAELVNAVGRFTRQLQVAHAGISVKDTRSRWGSCTSDGRLSFSWRLILAPPPVLDYVAAHECAHLIEMNHSARFWTLVETCCPDWKTQRNWLRAHGPALQAAGQPS